MDEEAIKVNFFKPMLVLKIRETYKAPYHKNKYISIKKKDIKYKRDFTKFLQKFTVNWSSGVYELQYLFSSGFQRNSSVYSTLVRFDVRDGKVVKLWKVSPYSRREYPIWQYFEKPVKKRKAKEKVKKRVVKKKAVKKKPAKKAVKKKLAKKKSIKKKKGK